MICTILAPNLSVVPFPAPELALDVMKVSHRTLNLPGRDRSRKALMLTVSRYVVSELATPFVCVSQYKTRRTFSFVSVAAETLVKISSQWSMTFLTTILRPIRCLSFTPCVINSSVVFVPSLKFTPFVGIAVDAITLSTNFSSLPGLPLYRP